MLRNNFSPILFSLAVSSVILIAWFEKEEYWFQAENGLGYAFGIIGSSMMLLLLLYPARKYYKPMRHLFKVQHWFKFHMILGVLGPCFILLHSNFNLGSLNSNIALFAMLLVAFSGLIGRYVYEKIHRGLYGEQINFSDLYSDYQSSKVHIYNAALLDKRFHTLVADIEESLNHHRVSLTVSFSACRKISQLRYQTKKSFEKLSNKSTDANQMHTTKQNYISWSNGLNKLKTMALYALYARVFSLWHVFHLPIFLMMIITAIVHIFVVHMY